jgi:hypothetical protein
VCITPAADVCAVAQLEDVSTELRTTQQTLQALGNEKEALQRTWESDKEQLEANLEAVRQDLAAKLGRLTHLEGMPSCCTSPAACCIATGCRVHVDHQCHSMPCCMQSPGHGWMPMHAAHGDLRSE